MRASQMNIEYVSRNFQLNNRIREYSRQKLEKLLPFLEEPIEARVTLEVKKHRHIADLNLTHRFGIIQSNDETDDMMDAINLVVDKAHKQARRARQKFADQRRRAAHKHAEQQWPVEVLERASVGAGGRPRIIKSSALTIKPMTLDEAALRLESGNNEFVVFRNAASNRINVLYRRRDENYGLIAPED